ncbi:MAG: aminotransferase class I/II-fold pyridoxal phosphate-dependent enzyme, partial [Clostridia bacterium]
MSRFWNERTRGLKPYTPGEQPKETMIKLNTNENPFPPSDKVLRAMRKAANGDLRLYPDPEAVELREVFAKYAKVEAKNVFVGNGSDEVLSFAFDAFFFPDKPVLFPDVTYSFYPVYCDHLGLTYETVPLKDDFTIDPEDYDRENGGIIIANPNAPTG